MAKLFSILLAVLSVAAVAAAGVIEPDQVAGRRSSPTCVSGSQASPSGYDIDYAAVGDPAGNRFYDIDPAFTKDHSVGSAMVSRLSTPSWSSGTSVPKDPLPFPYSHIPRSSSLSTACVPC